MKIEEDNRLTALRPSMTDSDANNTLHKLRSSLEPLEVSLFGTAGVLYEFFHSNGYLVRRDETIVDALANHQGWVYAFYGEQDIPLYVGETRRTFTERFGEHNKSNWWGCWTRVKVLPCPDQALRKILESIVGLFGGYLANKLQPELGDNALDDVVLCLLKLGNDKGTLPSFPNDMIREHVRTLSSQFGGDI